jgi:hypothetical protein
VSEVKLNLIDSQTILSGTIHGSIVDSCIAALSAEPETIAELAAALGRYILATDDSNPFGWFHRRSVVDERPYDAGIVIIDLAARIVAAESTYSHPSREGVVNYHNGHHGTDIHIQYHVADDWLFVNSIDAHRWSRERRLEQRKPPIDTRAVLFGRPLLEFINGSVTAEVRDLLKSQALANEIRRDESKNPLVRLHSRWLMANREDLQGRSPRDVMLEKRDFINLDMDSRALQWSLLNEGPPCIDRQSFAYRFAGFGTHEWVVYYDLVRYLLECAVDFESDAVSDGVSKLEKLKAEWLETGNEEYSGRTPAVIIDNERKRLPEALSPEQLIIDENCDCCRMMAQDAAMGFGPGFWHLDGSHMEEEFAFSTCKTIAEWELENQRREESYLEFEREWAEREYRRREEIREWDEEQMRLEMEKLSE